MTIWWGNGLLWIPSPPPTPLLFWSYKLIFHLFSQSPPPFSLRLLLSLLPTDSSLAQAITAQTPLSWHIYTTKDRTEQGKNTWLNVSSNLEGTPTLLLVFCLQWLLYSVCVFLFWGRGRFWSMWKVFVLTKLSSCISLVVRTSVVIMYFLCKHVKMWWSQHRHSAHGSEFPK